MFRRFSDTIFINENTSCFVIQICLLWCDFPGMAHDAMLAWAYGVNRTLERGGEPDDGETVVKNIFNFAFTGISGEVKL